MNGEQLEHCLRAATRIAESSDILVIGSQAILASKPESDLPAPVVGSNEVDVAFLEDEDNIKSDLVDGAIGEFSLFHQTHGYYAQGVSVTTAVLPSGWQDRLVPWPGPSGDAGVVCLEKYDLVCSKLVAFRDKDRAFAKALLDAELIHPLALRAHAVLLPERHRETGLDARAHVLSWTDSYTPIDRRASVIRDQLRSGSGAHLREPRP